MDSRYFKRITQLFFLSIFIFLNNSCETIDDLQFDNLGLRSQIDSLMTRVTLLTEEIVEQKTLTKNLTDDLSGQVSENKDVISQTGESLSNLISEVDNVEQDLGTLNTYVGDMITTTGDLTGELNNLLTQVGELNVVIDQVNNSINSIQGNLHAHEDTDNDGVNNSLDDDDDGDGTPDAEDAFPEDPGEISDSDGDGVGNNQDIDDDDDGIPDNLDNEDNNADPDPDPTICSDCPQKIPGRDIYVVGFSETEGGTYWVNGQKKIINPDGELTGITVSGGKIYASGFVYGTSASYWEIDGQNIQQVNLPGYAAETNDIAVHDGNVYVGGHYSNTAESKSFSCHWKNGVKYDNSSPGTSNSWGLVVKTNGDIVTAGSSFPGGHHGNVPTYWINNNRNTLSISGQEPEATIEDLAMHPQTGALRFCGDYSNANAMVTSAVHFKPGMNKNSRGSWEDSFAYGITVDQGGSVYTAGLVNKLVINSWNGNTPNFEIFQKPAYWINKQLKILQGASVNGVMLDEGTARDIKIVDGKVVVLGYLNGMNYDTNNDGIPDDWDGDGMPDKNHDTGYPCLWIDGTPHVLDTQHVGEFYSLHIR